MCDIVAKPRLIRDFIIATFASPNLTASILDGNAERHPGQASKGLSHDHVDSSRSAILSTWHEALVWKHFIVHAPL
jgi:hypothetical protein